MKTILIILSSIFVLSAKAHENTSEPKFKYNIHEDTCDIRAFMSYAFDHTDFRRFKEYPYNFMATFQFQIDTTGNVINVKGNTTTLAFLFTYIDSLLKSSNGKWLPAMVNNKKVVSKPYLLPVLYIYDNNYGTREKYRRPNFDYDFLQYSIAKSTCFDALPSYSEKPNYKVEPLKHIFNPWFSNEKPLDVYLLSPIYITPNTVY